MRNVRPDRCKKEKIRDIYKALQLDDPDAMECKRRLQDLPEPAHCMEPRSGVSRLPSGALNMHAPIHQAIRDGDAAPSWVRYLRCYCISPGLLQSPAPIQPTRALQSFFSSMLAGVFQRHFNRVPCDIRMCERKARWSGASHLRRRGCRTVVYNNGKPAGLAPKLK